MLRKPWNRHLAIFFGTACLAFAQTGLAVEFANIAVVDGADPIADPPTVSILAGQGTANFNLGTGPIRGLFPVRIGADATDDAANGVLLGYVSENGRDELDSLGATETLYATSASSRRNDGSFSLMARRAGNINPDPDTLYVSGAPFNANLSAAYFPFSEGWMGATVYNASNGTVLNELVGSPGLTIGLAQPANFIQDFYGTGDNLVTLPGVTDTRRQGLLFVGGGKNEDNYGLSEPTADGSGFNVTLRDNGSGSSNGEVDPVSFVFIPVGTPNITMARVNGRGYGQNPEPFAMVSSGGDFTVSGGTPTSANPGEYHLSIDGQTPSSGTLLVSASGTSDGANGFNGDNIVTYEADGSGWKIFVQDGPELTGAGQSTGGFNLESTFSFAFMPFDAPVTAPGPIPAVETLTNFSRQRVIGWNTEVTDVNGGNNFGDMYMEVAEGTSDVTVLPALENLGDNAFMVDGAFFGKADGVLFVTVSEGLRDNSGVGGLFEYGIASADAEKDNDDEWSVHTAAADPQLDEHNINFASVFFGADTGFIMDQAVSSDGTSGQLDVVISGANSLTDGVLIVNPSGNVRNFVTAAPKGDGSGWDVSVLDDSTEAAGGDDVNYIYLPFDADNLIAGLVSENGSLDASTDTNDFTLTRSAEGEYLLTIPGKTPEDGMLLLTSTGEGDSADNTLAYEPAGSSFRILGLDMLTAAESGLGSLVSPEDTAFSFAYIDFENPAFLSTGGELAGDYNGDGFVDAADYTVWRDALSTNVTPGSGADGNGDGFIDESDYAVWVGNYGSSNLVAISVSVPEPGSIALLALLLGFSSALARPVRKS